MEVVARMFSGKKLFLKISQNLQGSRSDNLQLFKRDSNTGLFLWNLQNF